MKTLFLTAALLCTGLIFSNQKNNFDANKQGCFVENPSNGSIQVALLLDTSNSMDGLINQAKSRLWNIVNTLTTLKYEGKTPQIEIALYEYGNSGLSQQSDYIRQVVGLTRDLDLISEHLFALHTNGGLEYCGAVLKDATYKLDWNADNKGMKLIYIAGNEPFNQGSVNYKEAIADAQKKGIFINTIFCGNKEEGIRTFWKDGADIGQGKYFNIDSNARIQYIVTPYDQPITICNQQLNSTYISYGRQGYLKKENQTMQDVNAESLSGANYAERVVSKSKAVYSNESWDLVDKVKTQPNAIAELKEEELPAELKGKSNAEIKDFVEAKTKVREKIQKEIAVLAKKRQDFIDAEMKKTEAQDDLGNAIVASIQEFAKVKGYKIEKR